MEEDLESSDDLGLKNSGFKRRLVYPVIGVHEDIDRILSEFSKSEGLRFVTFSEIWQQMNFSAIHAGRQGKREKREFVEEAFKIASTFMFFPYTLKVRVGSLYLLYSLYTTQLSVPKVQIRLSLENWKEAMKFHEDLKNNNHRDADYIFRLMLNVYHAFHLVYSVDQVCHEELFGDDSDEEEDDDSFLHREDKDLQDTKDPFFNLHALPITNLIKQDYLSMIKRYDDDYLKNKLDLTKHLQKSSDSKDYDLDLTKGRIITDLVNATSKYSSLHTIPTVNTSSVEDNDPSNYAQLDNKTLHEIALKQRETQLNQLGPKPPAEKNYFDIKVEAMLDTYRALVPSKLHQIKMKKDKLAKEQKDNHAKETKKQMLDEKFDAYRKMQYDIDNPKEYDELKAKAAQSEAVASVVHSSRKTKASKARRKQQRKCHERSSTKERREIRALSRPTAEDVRKSMLVEKASSSNSGSEEIPDSQDLEDSSGDPEPEQPSTKKIKQNASNQVETMLEYRYKIAKTSRNKKEQSHEMDIVQKYQVDLDSISIDEMVAVRGVGSRPDARPLLGVVRERQDNKFHLQMLDGRGYSFAHDVTDEFCWCLGSNIVYANKLELDGKRQIPLNARELLRGIYNKLVEESRYAERISQSR